MLDITTVYNLTDTVIRSHNRSSSTSTSVSVTRAIFENSVKKNLPILIAINVYNQYMSEVDIANQLQTAFTTLQSQNLCYWKSLFYWLLDIVLVNSYLLSRATSRAAVRKSKHHCDHQQFQENLAKILMTYSETSKHNQILRSMRAYCIYCQNNQLNWQSKQQSFETDITNIESQFQRSRTQWEYDQCEVSLCKTEDCWHLWHENQRHS